MSNSILDPWNETIDFNIMNNGNYSIYGPLKSNQTRDSIKFVISNKNNNRTINISSLERGSSGFKIIDMIIKKININNKECNVAHLENISKSNNYSGSELMLLVLQLLHRFNVKKCSLKDASFYECERNNFFKQTEIPIKILKLLKNGNTFYSYFGFNPIDKTTKKNRLNDIRCLIGKLYTITWIELDNIIVAGNNEIKKTENNGRNMNYNRFEIRNINKWKKYWISIYNSWTKFKNKYSSSTTPFRAFTWFKEENCSDFIGWLELYSYTFINYNKIYFYKFAGINYEIPMIRVFNQLKEILNNVEWINNNIYAQPDTFRL